MGWFVHLHPDTDHVDFAHAFTVPLHRNAPGREPPV
jgi:hypothetical protein